MSVLMNINTCGVLKFVWCWVKDLGPKQTTKWNKKLKMSLFAPTLTGPAPVTWPCWSLRCKRMPTRWRKMSCEQKSSWLWWEKKTVNDRLSFTSLTDIKVDLFPFHPLPTGCRKRQEGAAVSASDYDLRQTGRGWRSAQGPVFGPGQSQEAETSTGQRDREWVS